jgi:acyl-CoA thioesterase-1
MLRFLASLTVASLVACAPADTPSNDRGRADSSVVVASEPEVPSDGRPVVVFLGTSLTAGFGLESDDDTYVTRLEEIADSAGLPFRAVNAGVSGETSAGGLRRLDWALRTPVDVLVLELGANDGLRGQDPEAMEANLVEIVRKTRARYADAAVIIAGMEAPPNLGPRYTAAFRGVFPRVAEAERTELIPFLLDGVAGVPSLNQSDLIHPTAEGHAIVARVAWPVLERVLRSRDQ